MLGPAHFLEDASTGAGHEVAVVEDEVDVCGESDHECESRVEACFLGFGDEQHGGNEEFQGNDAIGYLACVSAEQGRLCELNLKVFKV